VCAEVLIPDEAFLDLVARGRMAEARAHWIAQARCSIDGLGVSALSHAIAKMRLGLIDPRDIERWMGPLVLEEEGRDAQRVAKGQGTNQSLVLGQAQDLGQVQA
jgi:hypothetical protein